MFTFLIYVYKRIGLGFMTFFYYCLFLAFHILGAHYLYSYVPYNEWFLKLFDIDLQESLSWSRNMYDRFVHFIYGLLISPFFYRIMQIHFPEQSNLTLILLVIQFVMASSLIYEFIEWWLALTLSPKAAENYNGQQGDIWDAHQDMFLATVGSILFAILQSIYVYGRKITSAHQ